MNTIMQTCEVPTVHKQQVVVAVHEICCDSTDAIDSVTSRDLPESRLNEKLRRPPQRKPNAPVEHGPHINQWGKAREKLKLAHQVANGALNDLRTAYHPISHSHEYARRVVQPLATWGGKNHRVLTGHSLGATTIRDGKDDRTVIHAASHNYAGFYKATTESEQLHYLALQSLPVADPESCPAVMEAFHDKLAHFFSADFCTTTNTGYGSNLLAFSAILNPTWIAILDEKSHNSMNVGTYLSNVCKVVRFRHNDMLHLEQILSEHAQQHQNIMVAVEGLYSMDGTIPPLDQLSYLKSRYGFTLLVDEAHSLLSVGSTGHGCLELWNETHLDAPVEAELIDIRTATLSKSLASIGGLVCGRAQFKTAVLTRRDELLERGMDPVLTAAMVQCIHILNQPTTLRRRLERMQAVIIFVRRELQRFGLHIYGDAVTPVLPVHTGPPSLAAKMSYVLRKKGILATPVSKPAVGFWESRVRVCLSADHTDSMVNDLVRGIISAAQEVGIVKKRNLQPSTFSYALTNSNENETIEAQSSSQSIRDLILHDASTQTRHDVDQKMIQAGHAARQTFGVAAGGSRWISGTFSVHVELEALLAHSIDLLEAMTYADHYLGLTSTIAALCRPMSSYKKHTLLLPEGVAHAVLDGVKIASKKSTPSIQYYSSLSSLSDSLSQARRRHHQLTLYLDTKATTKASLQTLLGTHRDLSTTFSGLTILLDDSAQKLKTQQGRQDLKEVVSLLRPLARNLLVFGSFHQCFGIPGAFLVGTGEVIEEFRYSSRGYMFSTAPLPFTTGMLVERLGDTGL